MRSKSKSAFLNSFLHLFTLFKHLRPYRKEVGIGLFALLIVDALEMIPPLLLMKVVDLVQDGYSDKIEKQLFVWLGLYLVITLIQSWCRYAWRMYLIRSSFWAGRDLRSQYVGQLLKLSPSFYDRNRIGSLMSHATTDIDAIRMAMGPGILVFFDALFYLIFLPIAMLLVDYRLACMALIPMLLLPFISNIFQKKIQHGFDRVQERFSELSSVAQEGISSIRLLKVFNSESRWTQRFFEAGSRLQVESMRLAWINQGFGPALEFFTSLSLVLVLWISTYSIQWGITLGVLVAFQRYIQKLIWPMNAVGMCLGHLQKSVASYERLEKILNEKSEIQSGSVLLGQSDAPMVEAKDLSFRYALDKPWALEKINFKIAVGEWIGLTGPIGSGKSTLLSLLLRFYSVERGQLFVRGVDVNDWDLAHLRGQIEAWAPQEPVFFSESIRDNLDWGELRGNEELYWNALSDAALERDVKRLPEQLQTRLGERGWTLSGGQRQRLALARVFLSSRSLLLLDDVFSAMDQTNEKRLIEGLQQSKAKTQDRTVLLCSHRMAGLLLCDRIFYFESGKLIETPSTQSLLNPEVNALTSSRVATLLELQRGKALR